MNLYAWSREGYIVGESGYDEEAIITLYTLSEIPNVGDLLYKSDGTPAEQGELKYNDGTNEEVNLNNTVYRVGNGYIDVYGISETGYTELAPDFSRDSQNDLEVETEKPLSKLTIKGKTYYIKDIQARQSLTSKQDTLVSGTNIKTINNQSILGSGNIDIQGGGGSSYFKATNVSILSTDWITDTSLPGYGYKCNIPCIGVTSDMLPQVYFSDYDLQSNNYSTVCESDTNIITIYSKVNTAITIPVILAF